MRQTDFLYSTENSNDVPSLIQSPQLWQETLCFFPKSPLLLLHDEMQNSGLNCRIQTDTIIKEGE